jgi:hypothetical protein
VNDECQCQDCQGNRDTDVVVTPSQEQAAVTFMFRNFTVREWEALVAIHGDPTDPWPKTPDS